MPQLPHPTSISPPWANLGRKLTPGADLPTHIIEAGLAFDVLKAPVKWDHPTPGLRDTPVAPFTHFDRDVLYRSDNFAPLGIMGKRYKVVQPIEVMTFFQELADIGGFTLDTAGSMDGGARVWALAKVGADAPIMPGDDVAPYLLLATSFDGSLATTGKFLVMRFSCWNAISNTVNKNNRVVKVAHNSIFDAKNVRDKLGIATEAWGAMMKQMRSLSNASMSGAAADDFLVKLITVRDAKPEDVRESTTYRRIMALFEGDAIGSELTGPYTSCWQMLNAVTEYVDHHRGRGDNGRMKAAWFGGGDAMKSRAYALLTD